MEIVVAVTGASGAVYARRFLELTAGRVDRVHLVVSEPGRRVAALELGPPGGEGAEAATLLGATGGHVTAYEEDDWNSPLVSGSSTWEAMVIVPCSMGTLGRVAAGVADNVIARAADVALKERRRLILVCRETPLSLVHLRNMVAVAEAGGVVLPACPGWYHRPTDVGQIVDFVVQRIYRLLGLELGLVSAWGEAAQEE